MRKAGFVSYPARVFVLPQRLRLLPDVPGVGLANVREDGYIAALNTVAERLWGWVKAEAIPTSIQSVLQTTPHEALPPDPGSPLVALPLAGAAGWLVAGRARETESSFKSSFEKKSVLILRIEREGTVAAVGGAVEEMTGYAASEVVGRRFWHDVLPPEEQARLDEALGAVAATSQPASLPLRFTDPDGLIRFAELHLFRLPGEDALFGVVLDREAPDLGGDFFSGNLAYQSFLEQSPVGVLHLDAEGMVTFESHRFRQIVGETPEEAWIGRQVGQVPGLEQSLQPLVHRLLGEGVEFKNEELYFHRPGHDDVLVLRVHGAAIRKPEGDIIGGVLTVEDVTERKRRDEELRLRDAYNDARAELREAALAYPEEDAFLHEAVPILAIRTGADWVRVLLRDPSLSAFVTRAVFDSTDTDEAPLTVEGSSYALFDARLETRVPQYARMGQTTDPLGLYLQSVTNAAEVLAVPMQEDEQFTGYVLFGRQPTEGQAWAASEQEMIAQFVGLFGALWGRIRAQARYLQTIATLDDALFNFLFEGERRRYTFVTHQIETLTGYTPEALVGADSTVKWKADLVLEDDRERVREHDARLREGKDSRVTYRIRHRDGGIRWLRESASPQQNPFGRTFASGIVTDVTEQRENEEALREAKQSAESANRVKSAFLATMSHEIRTPLGAINGFSELLNVELSEYERAAGRPLPPEVAEFVGIIKENSTKLLQLVNNLFDLSNLEIGAVTVQRQPVALGDVLQRAALMAKTQAEEKGLTLNMYVDGDPVALGDRQRVEQIVTNLTANALKFTQQGGVTLRAWADGAQVGIEVEDTGVGMTEEFREQLFTPFSQEDYRLNRRYAGTGLGLALVKRLVDLMNGRIEVESEKERGSCFRIHLPATTAE